MSYVTRRPTAAQIAGLTYGTLTAQEQRETRASWNRWDVAGTMLVLALIAAAYLYFTG